MYRKTKYGETTLKANNSYVGEMIEEKVRRIMNNKEPITDGAPIIHTERKDGVLAGHDIRTDRFEVSTDAMDIVQKSNMAKREERHKSPEQKEKEKKEAEERKTKEGDKKTGEEAQKNMKKEGEA